MYNHAPKDYNCPICIAIKGIENNDTLISQSDIVYKDDLVTAFISSFFIGNNPGHLVIVPNTHIENMYDMPVEIVSRIQELAQKLSLAIKDAYKAEGITTVQNNEPAGNQHAFHYHYHVFPRYEGDELFKNMLDKKSTTAEERFPYAEKIKSALAS